MSDPETVIQELLRLNRQLLDSIVSGDWETYASLCDPTLSAFEPESRGHLVEGMGFYRFFNTNRVSLISSSSTRGSSMSYQKS